MEALPANRACLDNQAAERAVAMVVRAATVVTAAAEAEVETADGVETVGQEASVLVPVVGAAVGVSEEVPGVRVVQAAAEITDAPRFDRTASCRDWIARKTAGFLVRLGRR